MSKFNLIIAILALNACAFSANAQEYVQDEDISSLYASTKQVNQFIRRFNGEEDLRGKRLYPKDKKYRSTKLRKRYFQGLFDNQNHSINSSLKSKFFNDITKPENPSVYDFYGKDWFAEVNAKFMYLGKIEDIILYFRIEKETGGYKWSLINAYFHKFDKMFYQNPPTDYKFIHPMSHELEFMNLRKTFKHYKQMEYYTEKSFSPDYLSLFLYELKKGKFKFQSVSDVKFHVFQINDWYFEMKNFNRKGDNSGWLISNLINIPEKEKKSLIKLINRNK
ncbi:MAG: hypothetical protein B6I20_09325 [Bacteroidetes bacterium 4572_117]|nr:MAG: hypothetical protein B6I20_09325 [Bacteroidetes bacterium 4572_117]